MTHRLRPFLVLTVLVFGSFISANNTARADCLPDGVQQTGALYRICVPAAEQWNGDLIIWAHGYVAFNKPLGIPGDDLELPGGGTVSVSGLVTQLGYAYATTSYAVNGAAFAQGVVDIADLVNVFTQSVRRPRNVFLIGASEGGLVTALSIEKHPELYAGGLAACGPIGSFTDQVNYIGNFRVVFDYFFPGVIPGSPIEIPEEVIQNWNNLYIPRVASAIFSRPLNAYQLLSVTDVPFEFSLTGLASIGGVLWYDVFGSNDAAAKLGGHPFDNSRTIYSGSFNDSSLNSSVPRFTGSPAALATLAQNYTTSGVLVRPLVTLHTTRDPIVPYWHEDLYTAKVNASGSAAMRTNILVSRYGHCQFSTPEALAAVTVLVQKATGTILAAERLLADDGARGEYRALVRRYGGFEP